MVASVQGWDAGVLQNNLTLNQLRFSMFIKYYMKRQQEKNQEMQNEDHIQERNNSDQESSGQEQIEEVLINDIKIEELHESVEKLRKFVAEVPAGQMELVPTCVSEYCEKINQYKVKKGEEVVQMAQRRVNKMLRNRKIKRNWNSEDITLLIWLVSQRIKIKQLTHFSQMIKQDWEFISLMISGSTWQKCKYKWLSLKKVKLVTHKWTKAESNLLSSVISQSTIINWKIVSEILYERNPLASKVFRTAKQCREHWSCFLNPNIQKGPWTLHEDRRLLEYVLELQGSKKWSQIAKFMQGRTQNALKNRFNLLIGRQRKLSGHLTEKRLIKIGLNRLMLQEGQQERPLLSLQSSTGLSVKSNKKSESLEAQSENNRSPTIPMIPTVVPSAQCSQNSLNFSRNCQNLMTFFRGNLQNMGNSMMTSPIDASRGMFIGFIFPNQF